MEPAARKWDEETDILVVGSGALRGSAIALKATGNAHVVRGSGEPVAGLCDDMASVMRCCCLGGGMTRGPPIAFAYLAANHAFFAA